MTFQRNTKLKKGNIALYIILIAIVIVAMASLKRCIAVNETATTPSDGTINVAIEYSPLSLYTYDDTLGGFCYDFMRLVENVSKRKFVFHPIVTLENTLSDLDNGKYDMVVAQFPATKENKIRFLLSDALHLDKQVLIQRKNDSGGIDVKSQLDLADETVFIVKGSPMYSRLENLSREIGDTIHIAEDAIYGPEQLFLRTATGEIKYAVINETIAAELSEHYPNVDYSVEISFSQFQPVILRANDSIMCDSLNCWIKKVKLSKAYKSLQSRYFD